MEVGMIEVIAGGGVSILTAIGGLILKSQKSHIDLIGKMIDKDGPSDGNGNHVKTHMSLDRMSDELRDHSGTLVQIRDISLGMKNELSELNRNLRERPCIQDRSP